MERRLCRHLRSIITHNPKAASFYIWWDAVLFGWKRIIKRHYRAIEVCREPMAGYHDHIRKWLRRSGWPIWLSLAILGCDTEFDRAHDVSENTLYRCAYAAAELGHTLTLIKIMKSFSRLTVGYHNSLTSELRRDQWPVIIANFDYTRNPDQLHIHKTWIHRAVWWVDFTLTECIIAHLEPIPIDDEQLIHPGPGYDPKRYIVIKMLWQAGHIGDSTAQLWMNIYDRTS